MELLGLAEVEHNAKNNRMRAKKTRHSRTAVGWVKA
jgi:hypothetical protein